MSFAQTVKTEILRHRGQRTRLRAAQAYGLILFGRHASAESMGLSTEYKAITRIYSDFVYSVIGIDGSVTIRENHRGEEQIIYLLTVDDRADREKILRFFGHRPGEVNLQFLSEEGEIPAFLSGVYLACGTVTDPQKNYLAEFSLYTPQLEGALSALLEEVIAPPKSTVKRSLKVLYYRESEHIEDLLATIGASKAALELMEVKIFKDMRNKVNRVTNCETANIDKTVTAATHQAALIRRLYERLGEEGLPEELREVARLRVENPELSLRELCELLSTPISRSGLNHRLSRLKAMAEALEPGGGGE